MLPGRSGGNWRAVPLEHGFVILNATGCWQAFEHVPHKVRARRPRVREGKDGKLGQGAQTGRKRPHVMSLSSN